MTKASFHSLTSTLILGALAAHLAGCGPLDEGFEGDESAPTSSALTREATDAKRMTAPATATTDLEGNNPWTVLITDTGLGDCHGTLIHPQWVLTAAHCVVGKMWVGKVSYKRTDPLTGVVVEGSRSIESGVHKGAFGHPDYKDDLGFGQPKNDIALIRLAAPFKIDRNIQTAALPRSWANPGRVGTIVTKPQRGTPAGYASVVRLPQLEASACAAPIGFLCVAPPVDGVCHGDSGSGFVEILDGRATVVGVASNLGSADYCSVAGTILQLADVFAYRDWIYSTMGMRREQVDGQVRLRWSGVASAPGIMSLQCPAATPPTNIEVGMNVPGAEIAMDGCDDVRVYCQPQGSNLRLGGFEVRTFAVDGTLTSTKALGFFSSVTSAFADPAGSFLRYTCDVQSQVVPTNLNNGGIARSL